MALKRQYAIRVVYLSNIVIAVSYRGGRYQKLQQILCKLMMIVKSYQNLLNFPYRHEDLTFDLSKTFRIPGGVG